MNKLIIILIVLVASAVKSFSQTDNLKYTVDAYVGAGYGLFLTDLDTEGLNNSGFTG